MAQTIAKAHYGSIGLPGPKDRMVLILMGKTNEELQEKYDMAIEKIEKVNLSFSKEKI